MDEHKILSEYLNAIDSRNINKTIELIHDDVEMITPIGIWRKEDYISYKRALFSAFQDWRFNPQIFSKEGDIFRVKINMSGTQTETFNLDLFGLKPILPKGIKVILPEQEMQYKVMDNKVIYIKPIPVPGGGLLAILKQLGLKSSNIMLHIFLKIITKKIKSLFMKKK
jgi:hypothetical protein